MIACIINRLKAVILSLLKVFQKCLCFLRKRRDSDLGTRMTVKSVNKNESEPDTWDDWGSPEIVIADKRPVTTRDHIEAYRHTLVKQQVPRDDPPEEEQDLFSDMAPKIRKQKKIFIGKGEVEPQSSSLSRLAPRPECTDPVLAMGSELESWEEDGVKSGGWNSDEGSLADLLRDQKAKR